MEEQEAALNAKLEVLKEQAIATKQARAAEVAEAKGRAAVEDEKRIAKTMDFFRGVVEADAKAVLDKNTATEKVRVASRQARGPLSGEEWTATMPEHYLQGYLGLEETGPISLAAVTKEEMEDLEKSEAEADRQGKLSAENEEEGEEGDNEDGDEDFDAEDEDATNDK